MCPFDHSPLELSCVLRAGSTAFNGAQLPWSSLMGSVYDKKPPTGLEGPTHALHCRLWVVEVLTRVEELPRRCGLRAALGRAPLPSTACTFRQMSLAN